MNLKEFVGWIDWKPLAGSLAQLGGATLVILGVALWLYLDGSAVERALNEAKERLAEARQGYYTEMESMRLADRYRQAYGRLVERGVVRGVDRIALLELLARIKAARQLPDLGFRFKPHRLIPDYLGLKPQRHRLRASDQQIDFSLHDESDLLTLLWRLRHAGQGLFVVEGCHLARKDAHLNLIHPGNVEGQCRLTWLALQEGEEAAP